MQRGLVSASTLLLVFTTSPASGSIRIVVKRPGQIVVFRAPERTEWPTSSVEAGPPAEHAAVADDVRRQAAVRRIDEELPVRIRAAADLEVAERDPLAAHRLDAVLVDAGLVVVAADEAAADRQVVRGGLGRIDLDPVVPSRSRPRRVG